MVTKHIPQRTCIACRSVRSKRELARIVHTSENHVEADATGKKAGRGAYLCRNRSCWETILDAPNRLAQALKLETKIDSDDLAHLREFAMTLPTLPSTATQNQT